MSNFKSGDRVRLKGDTTILTVRGPGKGWVRVWAAGVPEVQIEEDDLVAVEVSILEDELARLRADSLTLSGLREALAGKVEEGPTCDALEAGRKEGEHIRSILMAASGTWEGIDTENRTALSKALGQSWMSGRSVAEGIQLLAAQIENDRGFRAGVEATSLRQERLDWQAASLNIRRTLAPLLGCDVDNEPADSMVGRIAKLYEARDERAAEKRGHDKALEWAAQLAESEALKPIRDAMGKATLMDFAYNLRDAYGGTFSAPLDPKAPVMASPMGVGGLTSGNVRLDPRNIDTTPPTMGVTSEVTPVLHYRNERAVAASHRFYLSEAARVYVSATAQVSASCNLWLTMDGETVFTGCTTGESTWRAGHGYQRHVSIERTAGWHTVALCVAGDVMVGRRDVGWSVAVPAAEDDTDPDTGDDDACIGCGRPLPLSDEEIAQVRAMLCGGGR